MGINCKKGYSDNDGCCHAVVNGSCTGCADHITKKSMEEFLADCSLNCFDCGATADLIQMCDGVALCHDCHNDSWDNDYNYSLNEEYLVYYSVGVSVRKVMPPFKTEMNEAGCDITESCINSHNCDNCLLNQ
jgi:hypothetical protein